MSISVVLLAYNEEENLKLLLPKIKAQLASIGEQFEILVIDTATPTDNTAAVCKEHGAIYIPQEEPHFGGAFRTGIKHAKMDKFLIMDSDGSHNPKYIGALYHKFMKGADVVIGSRYVEGGENNDAPASILMSKLLNTTFRIALGISARDLSTDFRIYHTKQLKAVKLSCNNYDVLQEVLLRLKLRKPALKIKESPISFDKRMYGESKRRLLPFIHSYAKTLLHLVGVRLMEENPIPSINERAHEREVQRR